MRSKSGTKESVPTEPVIWIDKTEKTFGPRFIKAEIIDNVLNISWLNTQDDNIREYRLYKWQGRDYVLTETINKNIYTVQVKNYKPGEKNQFMLTTVNTKGIENKGTRPIIVY
ncbi:MAG: fibronectin type III domain-containing protein [Chitinophagaceae bacterium]